MIPEVSISRVDLHVLVPTTLLTLKEVFNSKNRNFTKFTRMENVSISSPWSSEYSLMIRDTSHVLKGTSLQLTPKGDLGSYCHMSKYVKGIQTIQTYDIWNWGSSSHLVAQGGSLPLLGGFGSNLYLHRFLCQSPLDCKKWHREWRVPGIVVW